MAPVDKWDAKTWIIGVLTTVTIAQTAFFGKMIFSDLKQQAAAQELATKSQSEIAITVANQLNDLRSEIREMQLDNYAAWGYQLRVNQMILASIAISPVEWPEPPVHLKAHP